MKKRTIAVPLVLATALAVAGCDPQDPSTWRTESWSAARPVATATPLSDPWAESESNSESSQDDEAASGSLEDATEGAEQESQPAPTEAAATEEAAPAPTTTAPMAPAAAPVAGGSFNSSSPPSIPGYRMAFSDNFDNGLGSAWGKYGWRAEQPTDGGMGRYHPDNVTASNGTLNLRYHYRDGQWTTAGVSSAPGYSAVKGRWELRAKFPRGQGLAYVFLLWPANEIWPPEVDFLEGGLGNDALAAFYHDRDPYGRWDAALEDYYGLGEWHTYGVIMEDDRIILTLDGEPWGEMRPDRPVTTERLWLGLQTLAIDPSHAMAQYHDGGVLGGVPNDRTPSDATIQIDWVAHYEKQ